MKYRADHDDDLGEPRRKHFLATPPEFMEAGELVTLMAFQHKTLPLWGVQFHPESVSTEYGEQMMLNFMVESWRWLQRHRMQRDQSEAFDQKLLSMSAVCPKLSRKLHCPYQTSPTLTLYTKSITPSWVDIESLVEELLSGSARKDMHVWAASWLDSSRVRHPLMYTLYSNPINSPLHPTRACQSSLSILHSQ